MEHVVPADSALAINPGHLWVPTIGEELEGLLDHSGLNTPGRDLIRTQAVAVAGHLLPPAGAGVATRTGLVAGYVQSGKTMSFTSVIALAHDNGVPMVILFSGTKKPLHRQTHTRLQRELRSTRDNGSPWVLYENPGPSGPVIAAIETVLQESEPGWAGNPLLTSYLADNRTVVITVMKNSSRLGKVTKILKGISDAGVDLSRVPVLIVDDEADQAGLNTKPRDNAEASATFAAIRDLRAALPRHSYLQYTATPQAPLLLEFVNMLSPDFVAVLEPGVGYTGGKYFFKEHASSFVQEIGSGEAFDALESDDAPPTSLKQALASYVVASLLMGAMDVKPSSMLIHPSFATDQHEKFAKWVGALLDTWREILDGDPKSELHSDLVDDLILPTLRDFAPLPEHFDELETVLGAVKFVLSHVQVRVINSTENSDANVEWEQFPFWILVGGNKLDRGYTVEGLVTSYMPRGVGGGQADTIQQRARFFGYKGRYANLCRAWLTPASAEVYERYVEHEEALRSELKNVALSDIPLDKWRRKLLIDPALKPCRANVISLPYVRTRVRAEKWMRLERLRIAEPDISSNQALLSDFLAERGGDFCEATADPRSEDRNRVLTAPLANVIETLLADWRHDDHDAAIRDATLLLLRERLDQDPGINVELVLMDGGVPRTRSLSDTDPLKINNLMQGRDPRGGDSYPGDDSFRSSSPDTVTVQLHVVGVREDSAAPVFLHDVPAMAIWVPKSLASDMILGDA